MQAIDKYLSEAIRYIKNTKNELLKEDKVPKVYKGYVASFGTILKQSGFLPAVVLFLKESDKGDANKKPIVEAIYHLIKTKGSLQGITFPEKVIDFAMGVDATKPVVRREVLNAAIALKLALRTFKFED
jgi:CRISPR-associated protein Cmr5